MGDFFKPWRRKIGVVTLAMACVFMGGWMRSLRKADTTAISISKNSLIQLISREKTLAIRKCNSAFAVRGIADRADRIILVAAEQPPTPTPRDVSFSFDERALSESGNPYKWTIQSCGVRIGCVEDPTYSLRASMWVFPYWSLISPLTILSAYLLLSEPRSEKKVDTSPGISS